MRKKELIHLLEERQQRVDYLMKRVETMEDLINGYREREQSVVDAMAGAHRAADDYMAEAVRRAESILLSARDEAESTLSAAKSTAETLKKDAETRSTELLKRTEATVAEYESTVKAYNRAIDESAAETLRNANKYIEILKGRKLSLSDLSEEVAGISAIPTREDVALPDAEGDPAKLMHNIYQLQNREIPDVEAEKDTAPADGDAAEPIDVFAALRNAVEEERASEPDGVPVYTAADEGEAPAAPAPDEVPKVNQFVSDDEEKEALSLDDLLDEIIQAGDKVNNG